MVYNFTERYDPDELFGDRLLDFESRLNSILRSGDKYSQILALEILRNQVEQYLNNLYTKYRELQREDEKLLKDIPEQEALRDIKEEANQILDTEMLNETIKKQEFA